MKKIFASFLFVALLAAPVLAEEDKHRALAEELLVLQKTDETMKLMIQQFKTILRDEFERSKEDIMIAYEVEEGDINKLVEAQETAYDMLGKDLSWINVKEQYIDIYVKHFSEEDLSAMVDFLGGPTGQKFIAKQPEVLKESMELGRSIAEKNSVYYNSVIAEAVDELRNKYSNQEE